MKLALRVSFCLALLSVSPFSVLAQPTTFTLNALTSFGTRGDGSMQPGDSIGISPLTGNDIQISAPFTAGVAYGVQPGDLRGSTNGFNMRGIAYDPVSGNLIFVDTHTGQGGSTTMVTNSAVYVLDRNSGRILSTLNTDGIIDGGGGGVGCIAAAGVADDGVVYIANQINSSTASGFQIHRWSTADTNNPDFGSASVVAFTNVLSPADRLGQTMDVRGAGTNTQIIVGSASSGGTGTNVYLFTTADGTNFTPHRMFFPGITTAMFNDGIAFGPGTTFFAKQVGKPLLYLAWDPATFTGSVISTFSATTTSGQDPLYNLGPIATDNTHHLLAGLEEIGGGVAVGPGKVWLFDLFDPTNQAPAILSSRTYVPNFNKATAPMGYLTFGPGRLYANVVNNGMLASTVGAIPTPLPSYQLPPDYPTSLPQITDLPSTNRVAAGQTLHLQVFATPDVTNYQWYSNSVAISGAHQSFLDIANIQSANSGDVFYVTASNPAGSTDSVHCTLNVVSASDFFHPVLLWSKTANSAPLTDPTNYITSTGGSSTPNERCLAYSAVAHQLLVVRGPNSFANLRIFVVDPDTGNFLYLLNTNGMTTGGALNLCGIGVADDGAVYASSVAANDDSFRVYRWADTDSNTVPQLIWGTNSSAALANPIADLTGSQLYRFGDTLAVHGSGTDTEIILDAQNSTKYVGILRPADDTMTNWTQTGYLLQNTAGSYGFQAYGTAIGRSIQFGPISSGPLGSMPTFWQKRYNANGAPLAGMQYNPAAGSSLAALGVANLGLPLYTNGPLAINFTLNLAAAVNFVGAVGSSFAAPDTLDLYDVTEPSQAVLLSSQNLPGANSGGHLANGNAIAQVAFGYNPVTGTNYLFALDANNGIAAYALSGGVVPQPKILAAPRSLRLLQGTSGSFVIAVDQPATISWFMGTNPAVDTGARGNTYAIANAQPAAAGDYFAIASNNNGSVTSAVVHLSIGLAADNYTLTPAWGATPGSASYPYVTSTGGAATPYERSFAYNALSNQLIVVHCPVSSIDYTLYVVDATTGNNLYTLNTSGVIDEGASEVPGSNPIDLDSVAVADDGAVYVCSETPNASGGQFGDVSKMLHVYRWADSGPNTTPTLVYRGDPSGAPAGINNRWGDSLAAHGSGTNTELLLNSNDGAYLALLEPTDSSLSQFTNIAFFDSSGGGSIGRSLEFGPTNTFFEKRKGSPLYFSSYSTNTHSTVSIASVDSSTTLGGVFVDTAHQLAVGVDFVGSTASPRKPDAVSLYDISQPAAPMFVARNNFPINQVANNNFICETVVAGLRVYSLDANNGMVSFYINPPANAMVLHAANAGTNVNLFWGSTDAVLQSSPTVSPAQWTDLTAPGLTNSVQANGGTNQFYRLILRR